MDLSSMAFLVLLFCYSIRTGAMWFQVTPAVIHPVDAEPFEGESVALACNVSGLLEGQAYEFDWRRSVRSNVEYLTKNKTSLSPRYSTYIIGAPPDTITGNLVIRNITKDDRHISCVVAQSIRTSYTLFPFLTVRYFPADLYPICTPSGRHIVQKGEILLMYAITEAGYPVVEVEVNQSTVEVQWYRYGNEYERLISSQLTVSAEHQDATFTLTVTSPSEFPGRKSSCTIGPLQLGTTTSPPDASTTRPDVPQSIPVSNTPAPPEDWLVVSVVLLILLVVSLLIIAVFIIRSCRRRRSNAADPQAPGVELKPGVGNADDYLTPNTDATTDGVVYQTALEFKQGDYTELLPDENTGKTPGTATVGQTVSDTEEAEYTNVASEENIGEAKGTATIHQNISEPVEDAFIDVASNKENWKTLGSATPDEKHYQNV